MNLLARIISVVFHPLLLTTYLFALFSFALPSALFPIQANWYSKFLQLIFFVSFLLPVVNVSLFKSLGFVKSITMLQRSERVVPFTIITILYIAFTFLLFYRFRIGVNDNVLKLMMIIDALLFISTLITFFYKVSIHSMGICGMIGILLPFNKVAEDNQLFIPTIILILISGIVMSARLQLNAHKPREVFVGALVGLITGFGGVIFLFS